jgi:hypothetical protein
MELLYMFTGISFPQNYIYYTFIASKGEPLPDVVGTGLERT